ncbi:CMRF35-like molecule 8 isoform X1 [Alligator mississippiensis]|uniref:CMRF35-like molecule 8 isoform X1 n=1 Tax=Alligator mississippiensis TaxID=8496 RepID=UPI0028781495|nr:CMRF35-like molecule 8 isoform X1 [Alligator mississippiensis]
MLTKQAGLHALAGALEVHGEVGRSVALRCPYSPEHDAAEKLWCKYEGTWCLSILASLGNTGDGHHGRAAVHEIRENRTFALTMEGLQVNDTGIYECRIQMPGEDSIMLLNILLHISTEGTLSQPNSSIGVTPRTTSSTTFAMAASISTVVLVLAVFLMGILGLKWKQRRNEGPWKYFTWNIFRRDIISPAPTREDDFAIYVNMPRFPRS